MPDEIMRIYVACLASCNAGILHGVWIDLNGKDGDEVREEVDAMLKASPSPDAKEWAIHDYDGFGGYKVHEFADFDDLCELAEAVEEHGPAVFAWLNNGNDWDERRFQNEYLGEWKSLQDYAENFIEDTGMLEDVPDTITQYFDYKAFARDMEDNGEVWTADAPGGGVYVFSNH